MSVEKSKDPSVLNSQFSSFSVRIGDIGIALRSQDRELKIGVKGAMKKFLVAESHPDVMVQAKFGDLSDENRGKKLFDSGSLWQLYQENGAYLFQFISPIFGSLPYKAARFNPDFTFGEVYLDYQFFKGERSINPLDYPLDELLIVNSLAQGRGVEIHACGILVSQSRGYLFVGQSGAGKTTMAKLWEDESGVQVLSDDRIILRKIGDTIWMYGTPWHGEAMLASPIRVPLGRIYFLEKGEKNELFSLKPPNSITRLFACSFPTFYNRNALNFTLSFLEELVKTVPAYELRFKPEKGVVGFIRDNKK
jgi:hypothetical protein